MTQGCRAFTTVWIAGEPDGADGEGGGGSARRGGKTCRARDDGGPRSAEAERGFPPFGEETKWPTRG